MKKIVIICFAVSLPLIAMSQNSYDSISISRFVERFAPTWAGLDTTSSTDYTAYIRDATTIWRNPGTADTALPVILRLTHDIQLNGTGAINRCFSPRHSVNYYKNGHIVLYLLVCFQCDGLMFTDHVDRNFMVNRDARLKEMDELRIVFKDMLSQ